jgi:glycosyltransferase involved in cell wall biosynthesis
VSTTIKTVSVVIPCYNQAEHIRNVVAAILNQSHPPDEIIVVDDASTDNSVDILHELPVELICHAQNQGPGIARNTGLHAAEGEFIVYVDADAYAEHQMIAALLNAYHHPQSKTLAGVTGRGIEIHIENVYDRWRAIHAKQDFGPNIRDNVPFLFGLCMSFRREILLEIGGFDPFFPTNAGEDYDIGFRLKKAGYWLRYTPEATVLHQHSDTEEKVKRVQYNWYYWGYLARKRTKDKPWFLVLGTIRRLFTDTLVDILIRRDLKLAQLDMQIFLIKMNAMYSASRASHT